MARTGISGSFALPCAIFVLAVTATPPVQAQAYVYSVLHRFEGSPADGAYPSYGSLIRDAAGNLYGTTVEGGIWNEGTVYKIDTAGTLTVLYSFTGGADGGNPQSGLTADSEGNLYGTTVAGGLSGAGTVFKLDSGGTESVLYSFTGGKDGGQPYGGVIRDTSGILYGTTTYGGISSYGGGPGNGVVFRLNTAGTETVLHIFSGKADGGNPWAGSLVRDTAGNLYGTTLFGGSSGAGVVFKLDTAGTETVLHEFTRGADGAFPRAGLIPDPAGSFYGTAEEGGSGNCEGGCGVVFKLDGAGTETVLYSFTGGADGRFPWAGLIRDPAGNLYGTTLNGGIRSLLGVVFKLDTAGAETVLYSFTGGAEGANPYAGLAGDSLGNLYGTTADVGIQGTGNGAVFKLTP